MFKNRFILILVIVSVAFPILAYLLNFYTDWLFFVETGFTSVFTTTLYAQTGTGLFFAALLFGFALVNLLVANKAAFPNAGMFFNAGNVRLHRGEVLRYVRPLGILVCGPCLKTFNLLEKQQVGQLTSMVDIVTSMQIADKVISLA